MAVPVGPLLALRAHPTESASTRSAFNLPASGCKATRFLGVLVRLDRWLVGHMCVATLVAAFAGMAVVIEHLAEILGVL